MFTKPKGIETMYAEFSRPLVVNSLRQGTEVLQSIVATPGECSALAKRFGIEGLESLKAKTRVLREENTGILSVNGQISAKIIQKCVISNEDIASDLDFGFETAFSGEKELIEDENCEFDLENDTYSPIHNGVVDLGELVSQYLSLEIDPYPHKEGAAMAENAALQKDAEGKKTYNPFKALEGLIRK